MAILFTRPAVLGGKEVSARRLDSGSWRVDTSPAPHRHGDRRERHPEHPDEINYWTGAELIAAYYDHDRPR
jgi:hypothetical protein